MAFVNKEQEKKYMKEYQKKNKERINEYNKKYKLINKNKEKVRTILKEIPLYKKANMRSYRIQKLREKEVSQ
jgi:uncharacterized membrane-anchored protein